jgi:hypothetical protein
MMAAITSGFANTRCGILTSSSWQKVDLAPVIAFNVIQLERSILVLRPTVASSEVSLDLEVLLRSQIRKSGNWLLRKVNTRTVGLHPIVRAKAHTTSLTIRNSTLNYEIFSNSKPFIRQKIQQYSI